MSDLYELPNGWEWIELKFFGKFIRGVSYKKEQLLESKTDNDLILLRANNIQNELNLDEVQIIPKEVAKGKILEDGDVLFAMSSGSKHLVGKNILINGLTDYTFGAFCSIYRNTKKEILDNYYLSYVLKSNLYREKLSALSMGANINNLKSSDLEIMKIPTPPLSEQQRIVSKLDLLFEKIDKSIALHQKNMDEANAFMGSVLNDVFGELEEKYGKTKINDVVVKTNNVNPMNDLDKPFTYIDISSIDNKSFQIVEPKQLIGKEAPSRAKKEVVLGDIVYSTTRPNLKNISIVNKEYDNPIASTGFCVLRVNENTINSYLFYYLITDKLFEQIEPNIRGTQYPATSDKDLKNCNIPNTPLIIQQKVVKYLDEISQKTEKIKQAQKDKMNSLKALKASILDQAFKGEL